MLPSNIKVISATIVGLTSHWGYFLHGEHHKSAPNLALIYIVLTLSVYFYELYLRNFSTSQAFQTAFAVTAAYTGALFTSIAIYRIFFHRIRSFPGPFLLRITKLWHSWNTRNGTNHLYLESLNKKYGTFVRTGPAEITVFSPAAFDALEGPGSACTRSDFADALHLRKMIIFMRDQGEHDSRRRIWNQAFSAKGVFSRSTASGSFYLETVLTLTPALKNFEPRLIRYGEQLDQCIQANNGHCVDSNDLFSFYAFDVMGDLSFGKSYNMLTGGEMPEPIRRLHQFLPLFGPLAPVPWLIGLGLSIPGCSTDWKSFVSYSNQTMKERIQTEVEAKDISSYLIESSIENETLEQDREDLESDAAALLHAGSDTTATALIYIFYHLGLLPEYQQQIRIELNTISSISNVAALQQLPILSSFIVESLRLFPPVPTSFSKLSPRAGVSIEGTYIPANTTIVAPRYCIARSESSFERALDFIPERWTTKPWMVKNKRAWSPFSQGRYGCVAKDWAMKNLTYVTALLVSKYDIVFAPGEDGTRVWKEMKDFISAQPGKLNLVFSHRKSA